MARLKFLTTQEHAAIAFAIMDHVSRNPERKNDPTFKSLIRKFDVEPMLRGLDKGVEQKIAAVLADLDSRTLSNEQIAKKHDITVEVVEEVQQLHEKHKSTQG